MIDKRKPRRKLWLISNSASGGNRAKALSAINCACEEGALEIAHHSQFPADPLPLPAQLDAAGIDLLAIFAGDGTVNTALDALTGWSGSVLVLPGGTMNLLYHRLFGDVPLDQVIAAVGNQRARRRRPGIVFSSLGHGYAEVMAGPGTAWSHVREAMRAGDLLEIAAGASAALTQTVAGDMVACIDPPIGRAEGYPLLMLAAEDTSLRLIAYHAETAGEFLEQAAALASRDFRRGPHEVLGCGEAFTLFAPVGGGFGVLFDGEAARATGSIRFSLARCEVDLLATRTDG